RRGDRHACSGRRGQGSGERQYRFHRFGSQQPRQQGRCPGAYRVPGSCPLVCGTRRGHYGDSRVQSLRHHRAARSFRLPQRLMRIQRFHFEPTITMRKLSTFCAASSLVVLTSCSAGQSPAPSEETPISSAINRVMDKVGAEIATRNIRVSDNCDRLPKAEITPQGDFLVAGEAVQLTPVQRKEMLAYRQQIVEIAQQGVEIGKQGASLGVSAAGAALAAALSGQSEQQIRQHVEAQASGIRKAAAKICDRLPAMMATQQKLATDVPAFKPYATMTQQDIVDCHRNALQDNDD